MNVFVMIAIHMNKKKCWKLEGNIGVYRKTMRSSTRWTFICEKIGRCEGEIII